MKKVFILAAVLAVATLVTSCDGMFEGLTSGITGKASTVIGGDGDASSTYEQEYTSSIVTIKEDADPMYAVGLSMVMSIDDLLNISSAEDIQYPFLVYRVVGNDIQDSATFMISNTLTNEDLIDFDYHSVISGEFSENQLVGVAVSPTQFYVMHTGNIFLTEVTDKKMCGTFTGDAYVVNLDSVPMLSPDLVPMNGSFTSRVTNLLGWLLTMQEEKKTE